MASKNSGVAEMTATERKRVASLERELAKVESLLDPNDKGSIAVEYDRRFDEEILPLQEDLTEWYNTARREAREHRDSLRIEIRNLTHETRPNARTQNPISLEDAVCAAMLNIETDDSFDGKVGPSAIVSRFDSIGYVTGSKTPNIQVAQVLARLTDNGMVKKVEHGNYSLYAKGRNLADEALNELTSS